MEGRGILCHDGSILAILNPTLLCGVWLHLCVHWKWQTLFTSLWLLGCMSEGNQVRRKPLQHNYHSFPAPLSRTWHTCQMKTTEKLLAHSALVWCFIEIKPSPLRQIYFERCFFFLPPMFMGLWGGRDIVGSCFDTLIGLRAFHHSCWEIKRRLKAPDVL